MRVKDMLPPRGNSAMSVCSDDFDRMDEEEQAFLRSLATDLIDMLETTERALAEKVAAQHFDVEEDCALWSLLPAKVRTAIKRGAQRPTFTCPECGGVGTHTRHCATGGRFA